MIQQLTGQQWLEIWNRENTSRFSRAHRDSNIRLPQSARDSLNKMRARGVGYKRVALLSNTFSISALPTGLLGINRYLNFFHDMKSLTLKLIIVT